MAMTPDQRKALLDRTIGAGSKHPHFIQGAIKHPGAFTAKAKAAGQSTHAYAEQERHAPGKLGDEARLALTLENLHR
jgi:hypothetical protein